MAKLLRVFSFLAYLALSLLLTSTARAGGPSATILVCGAFSSETNYNVIVSVSPGDLVTWDTTLSTFYLRDASGTTISTSTQVAAGSYLVEAGVGQVELWTKGNVTVTCTPADRSASVSVGADAQNGSNQGAVDQATDRLRSGTGGNQVNAGTGFLLARGDTASSSLHTQDWNAWVSADLRQFGDSGDGHDRSLSLGLDRLINDQALVGLFVAMHDYELQVDATTTTSDTRVFGLYGAMKLPQDLFLDAYASSASPDYSFDGTSVTGDRTSYGLSVSGEMLARGLLLQPSFGFSAFEESVPAYTSGGRTVAADTVDKTQASLGLRLARPQPLENGLDPYLSLAAEFNQQDSTSEGAQSFDSLRLGVGFDHLLQNAGLFSLDLNFGQLDEDISDTGLRITYRQDF